MTKDMSNTTNSFIGVKPNVWNPIEHNIIEVYIIKKQYTFLSSIGIALPTISGCATPIHLPCSQMKFMVVVQSEQLDSE